MCDAIYIGNTLQTENKMDGHFSNLLRLLNSGQKYDSFDVHLEQHFSSTISCTDLRKYMTFKGLKQLKPIGAMEIFTKPNFNLCMEELLTIIKKLRDKHVTIMNNNLEIYGACRHKATFRQFCLSTVDPVFNQ